MNALTVERRAAISARPSADEIEHCAQMQRACDFLTSTITSRSNPNREACAELIRDLVRIAKGEVKNGKVMMIFLDE